MTRYDIMTGSPSEFDTKDNQPWPDPLSKKYQDFLYREPPTQYAVDDTFVSKPYLACYALYQESSYDDIVLNINGIPHLSLLADDTIILFPVKTDIINFGAKRV